MVALLDSVVVAGFLDRADSFHPAADRRVRELAGGDVLIASVITYAELLTGAGRGHHAQAAVRGFFDDLIAVVYDVDRPVAERAAELRATTPSLRMPDALILATADLRTADVILTGDHRWADVDVAPPVELLDAGGSPGLD